MRSRARKVIQQLTFSSRWRPADKLPEAVLPLAGTRRQAGESFRRQRSRFTLVRLTKNDVPPVMKADNSLARSSAIFAKPARYWRGNFWKSGSKRWHPGCFAFICGLA